MSVLTIHRTHDTSMLVNTKHVVIACVTVFNLKSLFLVTDINTMYESCASDSASAWPMGWSKNTRCERCECLTVACCTDASAAHDGQHLEDAGEVQDGTLDSTVHGMKG